MMGKGNLIMAIILVILLVAVYFLFFSGSPSEKEGRENGSGTASFTIECPQDESSIEGTDVRMSATGPVMRGGQERCLIEISGGELAECDKLSIYVDPDDKDDISDYETGVESSYCQIVADTIIWQMDIFDPGPGVYDGSSGFGSVRPREWSCKASTGIVRVQWMSMAGIKIIVTPPTDGCVYEGVFYTSDFEVDISATFTCDHGATDGCAGLSPGDRFESVVSIDWEPAYGGISHKEEGSVWGAAG